MSEPIFVSSPTSLQAGSFARTCQAAHLAGRVIRHRNDTTIEGSFRFEEAIQLYRTIKAFSMLLAEEHDVAPERMSTPMALCYSTVLALCDPYSCTESNRGEHSAEETEMQSIAISVLKTVAGQVLRFSYHLRRNMAESVAICSPFAIDCLCKPIQKTVEFCNQLRGT